MNTIDNVQNLLTTMSLNQLRSQEPQTAKLVEMALEHDIHVFSALLNSPRTRLKTFVEHLVKVLKKVKKDNPDDKTLPKKHLDAITWTMSVFNKAISKGVSIYQDFLDIFNIPKQTINLRGGVTLEMSFFPHKPSYRPIQKVSRTRRYIEEVTLDEAPKNLRFVKIIRFFSVKFLTRDQASNLLNGNLQLSAEVLNAESNHPDSNICVILHKDSRRTRCAVPVSMIGDLIISGLESDTTSLSYPTAYGKKRIPTFGLKIPCPCCKDRQINPPTIRLPFAATCNLMTKLGKSVVNGIPFYKFYKRTLDAAVMRGEISEKNSENLMDVSHWTCPKDGCKFHESPLFFCHNDKCSDCIDSYRHGSITYYHKFECFECKSEACGLCGRSKAEHLGEAEVCPRTGRITAEARALARSEGNNYCPCCDLATSRRKDDGTLDGCPHIKCPRCSHHFCAQCEEHLKINPITGTRYVHNCPNPVQGEPMYFTHPDQAAADLDAGWIRFRGELPVVNPHTIHHLLDSHSEFIRHVHYEHDDEHDDEDISDDD